MFMHPFGAYTYRIRKGDTLYKIAQNFNTTVDLLLKFNYIPDPNRLTVGSILIIPRSPKGAIVYTVNEGDTLAEIADKYNTSIRSIMYLNYIPNPNYIYEGQQLLIVPR